MHPLVGMFSSRQLKSSLGFCNKTCFLYSRRAWVFCASVVVYAVLLELVCHSIVHCGKDFLSLSGLGRTHSQRLFYFVLLPLQWGSRKHCGRKCWSCCCYNDFTRYKTHENLQCTDYRWGVAQFHRGTEKGRGHWQWWWWISMGKHCGEEVSHCSLQCQTPRPQGQQNSFQKISHPPPVFFSSLSLFCETTNNGQNSHQICLFLKYVSTLKPPALPNLQILLWRWSSSCRIFSNLKNPSVTKSQMLLWWQSSFPVGFFLVIANSTHKLH